mmetsp:Transcript_80768/g.152677  ORF Transcript_80768/g.152677 Transcript_80768/m.152677 type:complete len:214 (-) Transcript_80768:24-665(-)
MGSQNCIFKFIRWHICEQLLGDERLHCRVKHQQKVYLIHPRAISNNGKQGFEEVISILVNKVGPHLRVHLGVQAFSGFADILNKLLHHLVEVWLHICSRCQGHIDGDSNFILRSWRRMLELLMILRLRILLLWRSLDRLCRLIGWCSGGRRRCLSCHCSSSSLEVCELLCIESREARHLLQLGSARPHCHCTSKCRGMYRGFQSPHTANQNVL